MDLSQPLGKYHFDRDADGAVSTSELGTLMRSLGKMPSEADVVEMITQAGMNFQFFLMRLITSYAWPPSGGR